MRAILIVYDEPETVGSITCHCIRNGGMQKAKLLLKHLRKVMQMPKENISFLRTSRFYTSGEILKALQALIQNYKNEDLMFFYAGHGNLKRWDFGDGKSGSKYIYYLDLQKMLKIFEGRLIVFNECCHALSLDKYPNNLRGRYLLFGACRDRQVGDAWVSVINTVCSAWEQKIIACPKVSEIYKIQVSDSRIIRYMDIADGESRVTKRLFKCNCNDKILAKKKLLKSQPSLRRGSRLDFLCFSK